MTSQTIVATFRIQITFPLTKKQDNITTMLVKLRPIKPYIH